MHPSIHPCMHACIRACIPAPIHPCIRPSKHLCTGAACNVPSGLGTFSDVRSGNQHDMGGKDMGTLLSSSSTRTVTFRYKYVVGFCSKKGKGTGPVLSITVGGKKVWTLQLDLAVQDYPYDKKCGGGPKNYSPVQSSRIKIPAGVGGKVHLSMTVKDRNIHVVGYGVSCAPAGKQNAVKPTPPSPPSPVKSERLQPGPPPAPVAVPPRVECTVQGDPHVAPFIGGHFDLQHEGVFTVLARGDMLVQVLLKPCGSHFQTAHKRSFTGGRARVFFGLRPEHADGERRGRVPDPEGT